MARLRLTEEQKAVLQRQGSLIELDTSDSQRFMAYHNPLTGQEFTRLPADQYSLTNYMLRGLVPGRAPEHLRQRWVANRAQREAEARRRAEALAATPEAREATASAVGEDEIQERINRAVQNALAAAGIIPAGQVSATASPVRDVQLKLL